MSAMSWSTAAVQYQSVWQALNGIFCAYKPAGTTMNSMKNAIAGKLARELNLIDVRPPKRRVLITNSDKSVTVTSTPAYADHPLVVGPRYLPKDISLSYSGPMDADWSGVTVWSVGHSRKFASFVLSNPIRTYEIEGQFGTATDNFFGNGRVVEKATYKHIHSAKVAKLTASIIAAHQKKIYENLGVLPGSQEAYELAKLGLLRTSGPAPFIIYGLTLTRLNLPDFKLELQCVGEQPDLVHSLVHDMGLELRTVAHTRTVRRLRFGPFTVDHALLHKHWTPQFVVENIQKCYEEVKRPDFVPTDPRLKLAQRFEANNVPLSDRDL